MSRFSLPKISIILEHRRKNIHYNIETAHRLQKETKEVLKQCEEELSKANQNTEKRIQKLKENVSSEKKIKIEQCMKKISDKLRDAEMNISVAKKKALKDIDLITNNLTCEATEKLINEKKMF
jgi:F0F1-type ATP synthase membrane subunit b/b'